MKNLFNKQNNSQKTWTPEELLKRFNSGLEKLGVSVRATMRDSQPTEKYEVLFRPAEKLIKKMAKSEKRKLKR